MPAIAELQLRSGRDLSRDEWLQLAMASALTPEQLEWRSQLAALEHELERPMDLMLRAEEEGYHPGEVLMGAILMVNDTRCRGRQLSLTEPPKRNEIKVSKFVPGEHFHILDTKFDTLQEAINHLEAKGYEYGGLIEKYWPLHEGG